MPSPAKFPESSPTSIRKASAMPSSPSGKYSSRTFAPVHSLNSSNRGTHRGSSSKASKLADKPAWVQHLSDKYVSEPCKLVQRAAQRVALVGSHEERPIRMLDSSVTSCAWAVGHDSRRQETSISTAAVLRILRCCMCFLGASSSLLELSLTLFLTPTLRALEPVAVQFSLRPCLLRLSGRGVGQ